ncbi:serine/threonine protein kinase [Vibrio diabolicus]|uniref:serine/threonine-protein kinase n=1 Tax=Vibrio diabolicus TaxID=50719 RepID=UPI002160A749|nr:serine/threonine-protein kinase [Vibrio diabolicus]MCS0378118.1 serine/threonine protein kinase [Vibrio diabolicus]MCS0385302.1 serine/threonine protein kinase [Vibrio diabolicus]MCS0424260.1 serine/threonine protein kinase [Vibrio diabolicus]
MSELYIEGLSAPEEIKLELKKLSKTYLFTKEVEKGANGYLYFAQNRIMSTNVAVKFYYWGGDKEFHAEPRSLASLSCDNILPILDASFIDNDWAYFVTPYCENGDLDDYIELTKFGNLQAIDFVSGVLNGLSHLHAERLLHRDIKPSNIYLTDDEQVVIGDFGSLKVTPEGTDEVPSSSHSILYRPPESVSKNTYSSKGDIYQMGIVLYQLLGGSLPYDEQSWMTKAELKHFNCLTDNVDRSIYVDQCIKNKITKGKVTNLKSLPPWVSEQIKRVVRKATNLDPSKRYKNATEFKADLHKIRPTTLDWSVCDGIPQLTASTSYRILSSGEVFTVQKKKSGDWRNDKTITGKDLKDLVQQIEFKA